jgi:RNA polymerase sigma-70 factor (ECF subfamily)
VLGVRAGDVAVFERLFRFYAERLAGFVFRYLHSQDESEDAVQDIFFRIWRNHTEWRIQGTINDYLYRAARNQARDRLAHRLVVERHRTQTAHETSLSNPTDPSAEDDDRRAELIRAIDNFPERRRMVCLLRWRDGLPYADIARQLGISEKTVENQLARAFKALRDQFGPPTS